MRTLADAFVGCLLGGAVGDALGAPCEGLWSQQIPPAEQLLADFAEYEGYPRGQYTDDTQLTLATVDAIIASNGVDPHQIATSIARLWRNDSVIGPGGACTRAAHAFLQDGDWQTCGAPAGQAGNGTAMRTAAVGLFFVNNPAGLTTATADISRITHQDSRSIAGGVAIAKAAQLLAGNPDLQIQQLAWELSQATKGFDQDFSQLLLTLPDLMQLPPKQAVERIAWAAMHKPEFSEPIITPFVVPTVLAALWTVARFPNSWPQAVAETIALGGDVDTLGAIVGGLMGAKLGASVIPTHLAEQVVHSERIRVTARRYYEVAIRQS